MNLTPLSIAGLYLLESPTWPDDRGSFREWFRRSDLDGAQLRFDLHQANLSISRRNVVRGLHYSLAPEGQAKVVTCAHGDLVDVIVDVREGSPTFSRVEIVELSSERGLSVFVPAGVAHGFCVTSELAALSYLLSSSFNAAAELEINPFDTSLAVPWPLSGPAVVSEKDRAAPTLAERRAAGQLPRFANGFAESE